MLHALSKVVFLFVVIFSLSPALATSMHTSSIWLGGTDPFLRAFKHQPPNDYMSLFQGSGGWTRDVNVFELSMQFTRHAADDELRSILGFLTEHHIQIAMTGLMLNWTEACGKGIEGYASPGGVEAAALRIKQLGFQLSYLVMDEPLAFGSLKRGGTACGTPVTQLAALIAPRVQNLLQIFPNLRIGDDEPLGCRHPALCLQALPAWFTAYRAATGRTLDFFHADVQFDQPDWPSQVTEACNIAHLNGARFGVIIIGGPFASSDEEWTSQSLDRYLQVRHTLGTSPQDIAVESWYLRPLMMLPPDDQGTLTSVAARIARSLP